MNSLLPEKVYWAYLDTEIIEISTDTEASIELTSGVHFDAKDIEVENINLSIES
ncbi:MAG: hypothetical protein JXQ95_19155 [Alteromonas stellipolaris]|uniref:hypothetical protein n=1 Tax=Alteromonas stellipolaris TaxID=233316 RepID=UPI003B8E5C8C